MSLKSALISFATVAGIVAFAGQDPRLDYSFAAPKLDDPDAYTQTLKPTAIYRVPPSVTTSKNVSASFSNAPISDVLTWLRKQGVSFVIDESVVRNKRVSLNVANQPLNNVVDAIATALNGHWVRRGGIRVYKPGSGDLYESNVFSGFKIDGLSPDVYKAPNVKIDVKKLEGFNKLEEGSFGPEFLKGFSGFDKDLAQKIAKDVQQALKDGKMDDPAFWEKFSKSLSESLSRNLGSDGFARSTLQIAPKIDANGGPRKIIVRANGVDIDKLFKSITEAQKETMKSRGYLNLSDLTSEQKALLGVEEGADMHMSFAKDGEKIEIRSK